MDNMEILAKSLHLITLEGYTIVNDYRFWNVKLLRNFLVKGEEDNGSLPNGE
jgi:hypothetical protein